jgi:hypothetical protein
VVRGKVDLPKGEPVGYVYVENVFAPAVRGEKVTIEQVRKQFVPDWAVIQRGTMVEFPNTDSVYHNVFSQSSGNSFDLGLYNSTSARQEPHLQRAGLGGHLLQHPPADGGQHPGGAQPALRQGEARRAFEINDVPAASARWWPGRPARACVQWVELDGGEAADISFKLEPKLPVTRTRTASSTGLTNEKRHSASADLACSPPARAPTRTVRHAAGPSSRGERRPPRRGRGRATSCSSRGHESRPGEEQPRCHLTGDDWWRFRASSCACSPPGRERDAGSPSGSRRPMFWDQQTAVEAATVWGSLCNECHGGRRAIRDAMNMPPPPSSWGRGTGLFFGQRKSYEALFTIVSGGGPERNGKKSEMPAWRGRLAREQIWAILYFLEYQSGGIEGRFPPSLYPRQSDNN